MPISIRSLLGKLLRARVAVPTEEGTEPDFQIEELEARRLPAADITNLLAAASSVADPVVSGHVTGDPIVGVEFEIDRDGDGTVDASGVVDGDATDFTVDLRGIDSTLDDFEGTMVVHARAIELDGDGSHVPAGDWVSTEFFLFGQPPTLSNFSAAEGAGQVWTFSGTVGGPHAAGATIEFGGVLAGQSVQADSGGQFSFSLALGQVDGHATATAIDEYGQESGSADAYCLTTPAPTIDQFSGTEGENDTWTFTGHVNGPTAAGSTVSFGGVLSGLTAQADSFGCFSATIQLGNVDGTASAVAVDGVGRVSDEADFYCVSEPDPPEPWNTGSFDGVEEAGDYWAFSGTFAGQGCEGATVSFGGVLSGYTATLDSSGAFSLTAYLGNIDGYASASVVDPTGQTLTMDAYCTSQPDTPDPWQLGSFTGTEGADDDWSFSGSFVGQGCEGATVSFGGVLSGYTTTLDSSGNFCLSAHLGNIDGYASASVVDPTGQTLTMDSYCCSQPDPPPDPLIITSFGGSLQGYDGYWLFTGSVSGGSAAGATVTFGGVLAGASTQVDSAGNFSISAVMPDVTGVATAMASAGGTDSEIAEFYVQS